MKYHSPAAIYLYYRYLFDGWTKEQERILLEIIDMFTLAEDSPPWINQCAADEVG